MIDVIIVGSGAGGSSCALRLAEHGLKCLVLEEGPDLMEPPEKMSQVESFKRYWRNGAFTASHLGSPQLSYAEGCCAGGSTTINSGILQGIPASIRREMSEIGIGAFSDNFYLEAEARLLDFLPIEYDKNRSLDSPTGLLVKILEDMHHDPVFLPRWTKECIGANRCSVLCPNSAKPGAKGTFLNSFKMLGGEVNYLSKVQSFHVLENGVSVSVKNQMGEMRILKSKYLVLAGGATQTPQLIMRSRLWPDSRNRYDLLVHPTLKINGFMSNIKPNFLKNRLPLVASKSGYPNYRVGGGVVNPEVYEFITAGLEDIKLDPSSFFSYYIMAHTDTHLKMNYLPLLNSTFSISQLGPIDRYSLLSGAAKFIDAISEIGMDDFLLQTKKGSRIFSDSDSILAFIHNNFDQCQLTTVHIFGSLLQRNFDKSLGAPFLLNGGQRVLVSDASLIPKPPGVNTQLGVLVLGQWAAEALLRGYKR